MLRVHAPLLDIPQPLPYTVTIQKLVVSIISIIRGNVGRNGIPTSRITNPAYKCPNFLRRYVVTAAQAPGIIGNTERHREMHRVSRRGKKLLVVSIFNT